MSVHGSMEWGKNQGKEITRLADKHVAMVSASDKQILNGPLKI